MLQCKQCKNINICKIYEAVNSYLCYADIAINNCTKFVSSSDTIPVPPVPAPTSSSMIVKEYRNFNEESKIINGDEKKKEVIDIPEDVTINVIGENEDTGSIYIECPACKGKTIDDDLKLCSGCNEVICSCCATASDSKILCEKCWTKE